MKYKDNLFGNNEMFIVLVWSSVDTFKLVRRR
jgi:hypothetical protein